MSCCQRLLADLRDRRRLVCHMSHLCECVSYLHSVGVVHGDIKPQNVLVRSVDATALQVTEVQLVIADFDSSIVFPRRADNSVVWQSTPSRPAMGTFSWSPEPFHVSVPLSAVCAYVLPKPRPPPPPSQQRQHQPAIKEDMYTIYQRLHPLASRSYDVFSLGMLFLSMLYRHSFSPCVTIWVRLEIESATHDCCPAHVLLTHMRIAAHPVLVQSQSWSSLDLYFDMKQTVFKAAHARVISDVRSGVIPLKLCSLLYKMTSSQPNERPSISTCLIELDSIVDN